MMPRHTPMTVGSFVVPNGPLPVLPTIPEPSPPVPAVAHACGHSGCAADVVVQWSRRPTAQEIADLPPDQQATAATTTTVQVFACAAHAITPALAGRVHAAACAGPNASALPSCGCTPEALPTDPPPDPDTVLPPGW